MNAKITTDGIEGFENLTRDELFSAIVEMKKANAQLKQEAEKLTRTLGKQATEIVDLEIEKNDDMERIDFLCEIMTDLETKRSTLEASIKGCTPIKHFANKEKATNQAQFSLYNTN